MRFAAATVATGIGAGLGGAGLFALLRVVQHAAYDYSGGEFLLAVRHTSDARRVLVLTLAGLVCGAAWWRLRRFVLADAATQVVSVAMGSPLGREAAPKQVGRAVGGWIGIRLGLTSEQRRILLACGAGAGMASVYGVPLGGAAFALEVLLGSVSLPALAAALVTSELATLVARISVPSGATYALGPVHGLRAPLLWALVAGPLCGVLAPQLVRLVALARRARVSGWRTVPALTGAFAAVGALSTWQPELLGNGRNVVQLGLAGGLGVASCVAVLALKPVVVAGSLRAGAGGGLFTPVLCLGASAGALAAHVTGMATGPATLVGAAALLAAASRGPISAWILVAELTSGSSRGLVPLAVAATGGWLASRTVGGPGLYAREPRP